MNTTKENRQTQLNKDCKNPIAEILRIESLIDDFEEINEDNIKDNWQICQYNPNTGEILC